MTGQQFKNWRLVTMGCTQDEIAVMLNIHTKTVSNYECEVVKIPRVVELATQKLASDIAA